MAEKKKYNSILISGRKDQTLTYSKYVKDEESGESVKESLDKKVNVTDELTTQQIKDGAITNEKMAADSVGNINLKDGSVSNEKLEDGSITNEKLAENSITKDKLQDKTIGVEKLDNELRQTIAAATGLPEDLVETIQNVDDTLKDHQSQLDDKQSQIDDKQQQITANDEDISLLQTRSTQMEETIKSIAATGGASQATAVTYNNEKSKLTAVNIQSAVDEVVDKTAIKDEEGTVVETPFHYIQNEEFIFAKVDAEDKLLFGIQWDGTPEFGKTSAVEDKLQSQVALLAEKVTTIMGDEDTTNVIDTMNELKKFFAEIENTETLTGILANLDNVAKNLDKTAIKDEEGTVVETPFHYIQNEEFIFAKVDAEDKLLFGIQWDGTPEFGKTSAVEDKLQSQVALLAEKVTTIMGDEDTTNVIDTMNELKKFFAEIENTETLTGILANLDNVAKNLDKTTIKDEEGNVQDTPFRVISNEEFLWAVVDSEDRLLFGIYRETGNPYFPLNEMYHVEQNEEFFAVWLDAANHVLLGIRRDGQIIGEIHAVNALKQVISQLQLDVATLQEKVGTIDINLKELLDVFSLQENTEYMAVETDAEGKVLSATNPDGSHYIHNAKSETIPEEFSHVEDPEGRTEITTDAEDKILGYRDSEGTRHEHKISASHISLSDEAAKEVNEAFKSAGIKMENVYDFSKDSYVELPIPRVAAQVKIYAPKLPTTKWDNIEAEIEYNDKDGNYFRKPVILNAQGSSSMMYYVKNMAIDIDDGSTIKFGDFPAQDSFHLKKYFIDIFRGQCIVGYWLMEQVYQTREAGKRYPYEILSNTYSPYTGDGKVNKDFYTGAKCHPDGFPIVITWINSKTNEEKNMGVYAWNLKKSKEIYHADKKTPENIILDGIIDDTTLFGGAINWTKFEIRNPKSLIDINGNKYDGDNPKELSETDESSKKVKDYLLRFSGVKAALAESNTKETFEKYFIADTFIDYFVISQVLYHLDGFRKNWIWCTWDGQHWTPTLYDVDSILGAHWNGTFVLPNSDNKSILGIGKVLGLETLYADEIKARYKQLRDSNIFSVDNIISLLEKWLSNIGYENMKNEIKLYPDTPSYRNPNINAGWEILDYTGTKGNYSAEKTYNADDTCIYFGYMFKANKELTNIPPLSAIYNNAPKYCGFYNSIKRVSVWLTNRLTFLDKMYNYIKV